VVDLHRIVVRVIVRQVRAGDDQRIAIADQAGQSHSQCAAAFVALIAHDDRHECEIPEHVLEPRQLDFDRMLGALRSRDMSVPGEPDGWIHLRQLLRKVLVDGNGP